MLGPTHQTTLITMYNLASAAATRGDIDTAFERLDAAIAAGFSMADGMDADPALDALRKDPRYPACLARVRANEGSAREGR